MKRGNETFAQIRRDLQESVHPEQRLDEDMHAWLAFCEYVHVSGWWGTRHEIEMAWTFFLCGFNEDKED